MRIIASLPYSHSIIYCMNHFDSIMKNKNKTYLLILGISISSIFIISCNRNEGLIKQVEHIVKKEYPDLFENFLSFGDSLKGYNQVKFGFLFEKDNEMKIISVMEAQCSESIMMIDEWSKILEEEAHFQKVKTAFILNGEETYFSKYHLTEKNNYKFPLIHDPNYTFITENKIEKWQRLKDEFILLNEKNQVLLIGDIISSPELRQIFVNKIQERSNSADLVNK